jgi:hypothetical protein
MNFSKEEVQNFILFLERRKRMKKCSTSLAIKKTQIKTILGISHHSSHNGYCLGHKQQQMLVRMWEKETLTLVGENVN